MDLKRDGANGQDEQLASEMVLPLIAEELEISKRVKETGRIRISKRVNQISTLVDETVRSERYEVKRVPVNRPVDSPLEPRQEGDTLILPIVEEVLVVEKRLVLVEEVHITRKIENTREQQRVDLRKEEVDIERVNAQDRQA